MAKNFTGRYQANYCLSCKLDTIATEQSRIKKAQKPKNIDTQERMNVYYTIKQLVNEGKGKIEILTILNNKFPNSKLSIYFSSYIDDHIKKLEKHKNDDAEER